MQLGESSASNPVASLLGDVTQRNKAREALASISIASSNASTSNSAPPPQFDALTNPMARISILEEVSTHLNNQMKIMKKLMSAQLNDMKKYYDDQSK